MVGIITPNSDDLAVRSEHPVTSDKKTHLTSRPREAGHSDMYNGTVPNALTFSTRDRPEGRIRLCRISPTEGGTEVAILSVDRTFPTADSLREQSQRRDSCRLWARYINLSHAQQIRKDLMSMAWGHERSYPSVSYYGNTDRPSGTSLDHTRPDRPTPLVIGPVTHDGFRVRLCNAIRGSQSTPSTHRSTSLQNDSTSHPSASPQSASGQTSNCPALRRQRLRKEDMYPWYDLNDEALNQLVSLRSDPAISMKIEKSGAVWTALDTLAEISQYGTTLLQEFVLSPDEILLQVDGFTSFDKGDEEEHQMTGALQ